MTVYKRDSLVRERIPDLSRSLRLHAHLLHELVKEVLSFRVGMGLEPSKSSSRRAISSRSKAGSWEVAFDLGPLDLEVGPLLGYQPRLVASEAS